MSNNPLVIGLKKASIAGVALAFAGIILFLILWVVLGQLGVAMLARLFMALCLPLVVIAGLIGVYALVLKG
jgi:hypothetical protein